MLQRRFWGIFCFAIFLFLFPTIGSAETSGDYEYTINGNEATITDYTGQSTDITIPTTLGPNNEYTVTAIGNGAFKSKRLTNVTIPNTVITIGDGAFTINSLEQLVLPNSVQTIGRNSFSVNKLEKITYSTALKNIPSQAFLANNLKTVTTPATVESIDASAFENNFITNITIQNPNLQMAYQAFAAQTVLSTLIVPSNHILPIENYIQFQDASAHLTTDNLFITDLANGITYNQAEKALNFSAEPLESTFSLFTGTNRFDSYYDISEYGPSGKPFIYFKYTKPVLVSYKDASGNELATSTRLDGSIGENYVTTPKIIDGYTLKETPGNATGQFSETLQNVTYIYEKTAVQNGTVTVKYQDESGKTLAKDTVLTGEVINTYQTKSKDIAGYKLQKVEGNESATFSTTPATVTYIYEKIANSDNTNTNGEMTDNTTLSTNDTVISSEATKKVDKNTSNILPTTGDSKDALFFALGSLLTLLSTSFFFFKRS